VRGPLLLTRAGPPAATCVPRRLVVRVPDSAELEGILMSLIDLFRLDGRVVVITGASSGLGVGFAQSLAESGADIVLATRRVDRLAHTQKLVEAEGRRAVAVGADIANPSDCQEIVVTAMDEFGRVDALVNNAGVGTAVHAIEETPEQFQNVINVNLNGSYWMAQACAKVMKPGSSIVNLSSILALTSLGLPQAAYPSSKAGVIGLTRDLAQQWTGRRGIRVNALAPGYFPSEMTDQMDADFVAKNVIARTLVGRLGHPDEINAAVLFLLSDASRYITGVTLPIDGGLLTN
jgi:NAD(P)-dependent dehydrogenase (short-subunit alcohol dehydrogenase family)